jgi:hypothetical protein
MARSETSLGDRQAGMGDIPRRMRGRAAILDANAPDMFNNSRMIGKTLIQLARDLA